MAIYQTYLKAKDHEFTDLWDDKGAALAYVMYKPDRPDILRLECHELGHKDGNITLTPVRCLFEYDANGRYYYKVEKEDEE